MTQRGTQGSIVWATVVAGFLGSGKTTLIRKLLPSLDGEDVAVLVNDFGDVGLDAELIGLDWADVVELAGGCVCCAIKGDLVRALDEVLKLRPALRTILVEASGVADPAPIVEQLLRTRLARPLALDALVTVVDCANYDRNLEKAEVAFSQLAYADVLVLNKADAVSAADLDTIESNVRRLNSSAAVVRAIHGDVAPDVVVGTASPRSRRASLPSHVVAAHQHDRFESVTLRVAEPLDVDRFEGWVARDLVDVDRAKGIVRLVGVTEPLVFHYVGGRWSLVREAGLDADETVVTVIGRALDVARIDSGLHSTAMTHAE